MVLCASFKVNKYFKRGYGFHKLNKNIPKSLVNLQAKTRFRSLASKVSSVMCS